jgi:hypothetical protein
MACRPKREPKAPDGDEEAPTSMIFKSLAGSDAGRSFRNVHVPAGGAMSFMGAGSKRANVSFTNAPGDGGEDGMRNTRANGALHLRESLDSQGGRGGSKLPRAQTFERKKVVADSAYADDDNEEDENTSPNNKSFLQRSSLVAQLEMRQAASTDDEGLRVKEQAQRSFTARFKSTTNVGGAKESDGEEGDDDVIATA